MDKLGKGSIESSINGGDYDLTDTVMTQIVDVDGVNSNHLETRESLIRNKCWTNSNSIEWRLNVPTALSNCFP